MNKIITNRILKEADYIINTECTVRELGKVFKLSKSTAHKDLKERLMFIDKKKYQIIMKIFKKHIDVRHIRGGESTKKDI